MFLTILGLVLTLLAWAVTGHTARTWTTTARPDTLPRALSTAAALGFAAGLLAFFHAEELGLVWGTVLASDFDQYCAAVGAVRGGALDQVPSNRGIPGALLPALMARPLGVLDGMLATAWLSTSIGFAGLALWARSAFGRGSDAVAVVVALAFVPFGALARMVTFHPLTIGLGMAVAGLSIAAVRYRSNGMWLAGALGVSLLLLVDARGIVTAAAPLVVLGWMALGSGTPAQRVARVLLLTLALAASWMLAGTLVPTQAPGLEHQTLRMWEEQTRWAGESPLALRHAIGATHGDEFLWGHRGLLALGRTVSRLLALSASLPPIVDARLSGLTGPWPVTSGLALVVAGALAVRRRDPIAGTGLVLLIPALSILIVSCRGIAHPRYLAAAAPVIALPIAAVYALSRRTRSAAPPHRRPFPAGVEPIVLIVVGLLLLAGAPPTPMSRDASWRQAVLADTEPRDTILWLAGAHPERSHRLEACVRALQADHTAGHPHGSALLGWHPNGKIRGAVPLR